MPVVCVAGATGWTGRPIAEAVLVADDLTLGGAVARAAAGQDLGVAWGGAANGVTVSGDLAEALAGVDVLVDYTSPDSALAHAMLAIAAGVHVVIGTSGLSAAQFADIDSAARQAGVGVVAAGNFSLTAAMAQAAALLVAPFLPQREIIDYASAAKPDAPSGTARELAERLGGVSSHQLAVPVSDTVGYPEARGADIAGTQVHSLRLPSFVVSTEIVFAQPDERLIIRHDAGGTPTPYVAGTLIAVRTVPGIVGLVRGLDTLLLGRN
ncbi:MAG: 4-hydroxy-tetrahydrodipicolinate reductase [Actinobacteria bacterium]|nr:4-hydroxy-tetrahydrodipicolinate reductase [Actinomycetota bacterium]